MKKIMILIFICIFSFNSLAIGSDMEVSAESYILMDYNSGRVLLEKDPYRKMAIASTTKIMTALLAIENGNLDDYVEITEESVGVEGSSIYLKLGEKIKLRDLIYGLMLRSGNDSAVAIAIHISGSTKDFVNLMNRKTISIGALNTNFVNPHGLYDSNHYSTAYDLALITREAYKYEEFKNICASKSYIAEREKNNYFLNKNKTLWEYEGGDGVKIGYTIASGRCLVSSSLRDNMRLIAVSLNASDWFNDNYKLMDYGYDNFRRYVILDKGQFVKKLPIKNGEKSNIQLVTMDEFIYPLKDDEIDKVDITIEVEKDISVPISEGDVYGKVNVFFDGTYIYSSKLIARNDVEKISIFNRLINLIKSIQRIEVYKPW